MLLPALNCVFNCRYISNWITQPPNSYQNLKFFPLDFGRKKRNMHPWNPCVIYIFFFSQSYLLTCVFDTWSQQITDRIYVIVLILTAWLIPIIVILFCYLNVRIYHILKETTLKESYLLHEKILHIIRNGDKNNSNLIV